MTKNFDKNLIGKLRFCRFEPDLDEIHFLKLGDTLASFESEGMYVYYVIDHDNREDFAHWVAEEYLSRYDVEFIEIGTGDGTCVLEIEKTDFCIDFQRKV